MRYLKRKIWKTKIFKTSGCLYNLWRGYTGQALIEAIVALGVIVVGVLGAVAFLSTSLGLNRVVTNQYAGTYLGAMMIEEYKNCLDTVGWVAGADFCKTSALSGVNAEGTTLNRTNFNISFDRGNCRSVTNVGSDRYEIRAHVSWSERGNNYEICLEDHFYNWR